MRYFTYISHTYATRNALEGKVLNLLRSYNRLTILQTELPAFMDQLRLEVDAINGEHSKCNPIRLDAAESSSHCGKRYNDLKLWWHGAEGYNGHELCVFKFLIMETF
jgi:hypothetical protein